MDENNLNRISEIRNPMQLQLARGYFPFQQLDGVNISVQALEEGTIFPELDIPWSMD